MHPEQLPAPGELSDTPEELERMFAVIEIQLRASAAWYVARTSARGETSHTLDSSA
jgi:hypothetical protein